MNARLTIIVYLAAAVLILSTCRKDNTERIKEKKIANLIGSYYCKVFEHYRFGAEITDTTYNDTLIIDLFNDSITILHIKFPIAPLVENQTYFQDAPESIHNHSTFKFNGDSVYFFTKSGGQGGEWSLNYKGKKI